MLSIAGDSDAPRDTPATLSCVLCGKPAHLQCPKCIELKLPSEGAAFCAQDCFKASWSTHKSVHLKARLFSSGTPGEANGNGLREGWLYCLRKGQSPSPQLPHFSWTGLLRPCPISPKRVVPAYIDLPDWAVDGIPKIEPNSNLQHVVEIKTPDQIAKMRTGLLRLYPISPKHVVPAHIELPDWAVDVSLRSTNPRNLKLNSAMAPTPLEPSMEALQILRFDDVEKVPSLPSKAARDLKELDENKSKKGLAEVYEDEYVQNINPAAVPLSMSDEQKKEASILFKKLCLKLDALSHFHFAPNPVVEDMSIQANVPALAMEEIAPVVVSDATMLTPEEIFFGKGDVREETELSQADKKRRKANKKRKF